MQQLKNLLFQFGLYPSYRCHKYVLATVEIALRNPALLQNANKTCIPSPPPAAAAPAPLSPGASASPSPGRGK